MPLAKVSADFANTRRFSFYFCANRVIGG